MVTTCRAAPSSDSAGVSFSGVGGRSKYPLHGDQNPVCKDMQQLLKAEDLAAIINVSSRTILNWYHDGTIPARVHVGAVIRFELEPVMEALDQVRGGKRANEFFRRRRPTK
jgi:predicted DNA-binding transcriptional regulator AlpA